MERPFEWVLVKGREIQDRKGSYTFPIYRLRGKDADRREEHGVPTLATLRMSCKSEAGQQHDSNRLQAGLHVPVSGTVLALPGRQGSARNVVMVEHFEPAIDHQ